MGEREGREMGERGKGDREAWKKGEQSRVVAWLVFVNQLEDLLEVVPPDAHHIQAVVEFGHLVVGFVQLLGGACQIVLGEARSQWQVSASAIQRVLGQRALHQWGPRKPTLPHPPLSDMFNNLRDKSPRSLAQRRFVCSAAQGLRPIRVCTVWPYTWLPQ